MVIPSNYVVRGLNFGKKDRLAEFYPENVNEVNLKLSRIPGPEVNDIISLPAGIEYLSVEPNRISFQTNGVKYFIKIS